MKNFYDENNPNADENDCNEEEFAGYSLVDGEGREIETLQQKEAKYKKESKSVNFDCGAIPEASEIPQNIQTVMIDKAKISGVDIGTLLTLCIKGNQSVSVFNDTKKIGELKPAFSQRMLIDRKGQHVECFLHSKTPFAMIILKFYARPRKNTIKIQ